MHKIEPEDFARAQPVFEELAIHQAVRALLNGDSRGDIYLDDKVHPKSVFARTMRRFFLAGKSDNQAFNQDLKSLFDSEVYPRARVSDEEGFSVYFAPGDWAGAIDEVILGNKNPIRESRFYYRCRHLKHDWRELIPAGYSLLQVDQELLENQQMANLEDLIEEIHSECQSVVQFLSERFGFCIVHEGQIVTWCLSEYNSRGRCEVGIATEPDHQRKGLAKAASLALIEFAFFSGYQEVGWHCFARNEASKATALAAGFEEVSQYPAYWAMFDEIINLAVHGDLSFERGDYLEAADWYRRALAGEGAPTWVYWSTACAYAHLNDRGNAFDFLHQAVDQGFTDADHIKNSPHFAQWHGTEEWKSLIDRLV